MSSHQFTKNILVIGSVLLDIYNQNQKQFLGGACFNFAYHVHQLIGDLDFISRIGQDDAGQFILNTLEKRHFPTHNIQHDKIKPTKTVQVMKNDTNEPNYIIANDVATEYLDQPDISLEQLSHYQLVYFGTTIQSGLKSRTTLRNLLAQVDQIKLCDINLRPGKYTSETIDYALNHCTVLKLNHEELNTISQLYQLHGQDQEKLLELNQRFNIETICLTLAEKGSLLYYKQAFTTHQLQSTSVIDTVGAGDAFTAILAIGLLRNWSGEVILNLASEFAAAICQIQGAVPEPLTFYDFWKNRIKNLPTTEN